MLAFESIQYFALSDIGLNRSRNEDTYVIHDFNKTDTEAQKSATLFAVADGMGGHACGDIASKLACQKLLSCLDEISFEMNASELTRLIEHQIFNIDASIRNEGNCNPDCVDMGTTLSTLFVADTFGLIAHVGDSRIYRLRDNCLDQLTTDHTFVQEMIEEGELTAASAERHPFRNMLTGVVGTPEPLEKVETHIINFKPGDQLLLSTDGLHGLVSTPKIRSTLQGQKTPRQAARHLINLALKQGGRDNVTVIVIYL